MRLSTVDYINTKSILLFRVGLLISVLCVLYRKINASSRLSTRTLAMNFQGSLSSPDRQCMSPCYALPFAVDTRSFNLFLNVVLC